MTSDPLNRMATRRERGRPKDDDKGPPAVEAQPVLLLDSVPPLVCPKCGRGMQPKVMRKRPNGERDCACTLCAREFVYTPPRVREK